MATRSSATGASQKLFVEPTTLYFPPPLVRGITNVVTVYNSTTEPCVFKVHSFEPELYTVKPSAAIVGPNSACRVQITLRKMRNEPESYTDLTRKQRFKVRAKVVPASLYAKSTAKDASAPSAADVWKACDAVPYVMDSTLNCNFSGELPQGAAVTYDDHSNPNAGQAAAVNAAAAAVGGGALSPNSKEDPYATAKKSAPQATNKNVTFGAQDGSGGNGGSAGFKSSLKGDALITPRNAGEVVSAESASIRANTTAKAAVATAVGDYNSKKAQLEREIKERQALLESLNNAGSAGGKKSELNATKLGKGKMKGLSLAVVLILIIVFYVAGTIARVKVGHHEVNRIVQHYVPEEVRSVAATSKAALDEVTINIISNVIPVGEGAASAPVGAVTSSGIPLATEVGTEAVVPPAAEVAPLQEAKQTAEEPVAFKTTEKVDDAPEKKKKRKRKVKKQQEEATGSP